MTTTFEAAPERVGVIGGGLAGLSAACTLAARGHAVTLFEKNPWLGGKAAVGYENKSDHSPWLPRMIPRADPPITLRQVFVAAQNASTAPNAAS